ncbi:peptidoglycan-binding domain-containing protein [Stackebrandtia nassauensis]|uniref:Peptidoglycan-binding domain 1 protein n=1 Tax=Stackebrandtia nassauensis (strain DSM 44728 / CIP 108903 / NRRL B-16338 / NBRC 102104 / LLR-40K-21) TaxID=446470 RepID=D3Q9G0_STANL|nr:peptidoglycan-binding protein [Stackebrandtia nassauensis]ADD42642.1 Peptidoglycan-binding domain 1 protein [Stackebrandtia nassauensis DSM 44728]
MRNLKWKIAATASVVALGVGGAVGFSGVAAAEPTILTSTSFVDGLDKVTDDFNDHARELGAPLSDHGKNSWGTDIVIVWQAILAADGYLTYEGVDGYFGAKTAAATAKWQADRGIDADKPGTVGHTTWAYADNNLIADDGTVDYRTPGLGVVVFKRAPGPDGHYTLVSTADAADGYGWRNRGGDHIYFSKMTLRLALE